MTYANETANKHQDAPGTQFFVIEAMLTGGLVVGKSINKGHAAQVNPAGC
jgi:hypothetical protein